MGQCLNLPPQPLPLCRVAGSKEVQVVKHQIYHPLPRPHPLCHGFVLICATACCTRSTLCPPHVCARTFTRTRAHAPTQTHVRTYTHTCAHAHIAGKEDGKAITRFAVQYGNTDPGVVASTAGKRNDGSFARNGGVFILYKCPCTNVLL